MDLMALARVPHDDSDALFPSSFFLTRVSFRFFASSAHSRISSLELALERLPDHPA
jgi:hypothetical protein